MSPLTENRTEENKLAEKKGKHPVKIPLKPPSLPVGARNPYAIYRAYKKHINLSELPPEEVQKQLSSVVGNGKRDYTQLFDPLWGSCLFCQKTIDAASRGPFHIDAKEDSVVKEDPKTADWTLKKDYHLASSRDLFLRSENVSDSIPGLSPDGAAVGAPGDITVCEKNLANASWVIQNGMHAEDPLSLYWPWFDPAYSATSSAFPDEVSPAFDEAFQGPILDCYFLAALSSIAWYYKVNEKRTTQVVTDQKLPIPFSTTANVTITVGSALNNAKVLTDYSLPLDLSQLPPAPVGVSTKSGHVSWAAFYEKAFARYLESTGKMTPVSPDPNHPDICRIPCGYPGETLRSLMNKSTTYLNSYNMEGKAFHSSARNAETVWTKLKTISETLTLPSATEPNPWNAWKAKYPAVARTNCTSDPNKTGNTQPPVCAAPAGSGVYYDDCLILASHAYSLLGLHILNSKRYVILRNPYNENLGFIKSKVAYVSSLSDGPLVFYTIKNSGGNRYRWVLYDAYDRPVHGVFALQVEDFVNYFAEFNWVIN